MTPFDSKNAELAARVTFDQLPAQVLNAMLGRPEVPEPKVRGVNEPVAVKLPENYPHGR